MFQSFVHVSTAYSNCHLPEVYEELYPAPIDPGRLIQLTEWLDDRVLEDLTPRLVSPRPNTYTYTKALAEHLLVNDAGKLPISIVRPSIGRLHSHSGDVYIPYKFVHHNCWCCAKKNIYIYI